MLGTVLMAKTVAVPMKMMKMMTMIARPDGDDALLKWQPWLSPFAPPYTTSEKCATNPHIAAAIQ